MKKLYVLVCLVSLSVMSFGQTYLLEDFSGNQMPPADWSIDNLADQWSINNGDEAGGIAPEGKFSYISGNYTSRLISPEVDLTDVTSLSFQFSHFLDDYSGSGYTLGVATRSGGEDWNDVWSVNPTGDMGPETISVEIDNGDVGASDFQICIYIDGNTYNLDYWFIDNLWLFSPLEVDAALSEITTSRFLNDPTEVTGSFVNLGTTQINSVTIDWSIDGGEVTSTLFDGLSLDFGDDNVFTCDGIIDQPVGGYVLTVSIVDVNGGGEDEDPDNNTLDKPFSVVSHVVDRLPMFEEFTSSTCAPCATLNTQFVPWCEEHVDEIALLKYQMNWPGVGDPYYTEEGGVRRYYYGVSGVPAVFVNGEYVGFQFGGIPPAFEEAILMPGYLSAVSSHTLDGTEMSVEVTLLPYANFDSYVLHVAVFEYLTTENVASNGETEFENVMMKMVPDAYGTTVNLEDRVPYTMTGTVDLDGTNVEEWDDLGVVVWLQEQTSQEVFQSTYSVEDGIFETDASLTSISVDGEPLADFSPDVFEYTVYTWPGNLEVPVVEAESTDPKATTVVVPANELPGSTTVDIFAEDLATFNTYTITFDYGTGEISNAAKALRVYPNPTTGKVNIRGAENAQVIVYAVTGEVVASYNNFSSSMIDLSELNEGIYIMNIVVENKTVLNEKISLLK